LASSRATPRPLAYSAPSRAQRGHGRDAALLVVVVRERVLVDVLVHRAELGATLGIAAVAAAPEQLQRLARIARHALAASMAPSGGRAGRRIAPEALRLPVGPGRAAGAGRRPGGAGFGTHTALSCLSRASTLSGAQRQPVPNTGAPSLPQR